MGHRMTHRVEDTRRAEPTVVPDELWNPFPSERLQMAYIKPASPVQAPDPRTVSMSSRSLSHLDGVDPRLAMLVGVVSLETEYDFIVIDGLRTLAEQRVLLQRGVTRTLDSYHITGHAIDVAIWHEGKVQWVPEMYRVLAQRFKKAATAMSIDLKCGVDFKSFFDGPHFQVSRN